ncbi:hypothetical protein ACOMHN_037293 [Nucella lapillus]
MVPDTQELCRRLEEKIANLTRMGSNLQYENQEMAQLISAQGHKLETVKRNERHMSDNRRFRCDLAKIGKEIHARNDRRPFPFYDLEPRCVPNSICI